MAFSPMDELRIEAIERQLNDIQKALNNVATTRQLNIMVGLFTQEVAKLEKLVLENTAGGLLAHTQDPLAHSGLYWYYGKSDYVSTNQGVTLAGHPVVLNSDGYIDWSLLSGVVISGVI